MNIEEVWAIQVLVRIDSERSEWRDMRPTRGAPYRFSSKEEAEKTMRWCYPESPGKVRVVSVSEVAK